MITSTANERIKEIRKLKEKKYRTEAGAFLAEGTKIVLDALQTNTPIQQLIIAPDLVHTEGAKRVIHLGGQQNIPTLEVNPAVFSAISTKDNPQGIAAVIPQKWAQYDEIPKNLSGIWLALYEVADPGNLGTILRSMDAVGGKGIFLIDDCTDPYDPASIRGSMGGIFSQILVKVKKDDFISGVSEHSIFIVGTADDAAADFHRVNYPNDMILLMGSEREGLPKELQLICQHMVSLPMLGICDSLNLGVATSVVLYEILAQSNAKGKLRESL